MRDETTPSPQIFGQPFFVHALQIEAYRALAYFVSGGRKPLGDLGTSEGSVSFLQHPEYGEPFFFCLFTHGINSTTKNADWQQLYGKYAVNMEFSKDALFRQITIFPLNMAKNLIHVLCVGFDLLPDNTISCRNNDGIFAVKWYF